MPDLPADVQAALDAYLAARVDDVTWERYVNRLGPGRALDVAAVLCGLQCADADAAGWIRRCVLGNPDAARPAEQEAYGLETASTSLDAVLVQTLDVGGDTVVTLSTEPGRPHHLPLSAWTATVGGDEWESTGRVTLTECRAWADAALQGGPAPVVAWAVALCRAICLAWAPAWARSAEAKGH